MQGWTRRGKMTTYTVLNLYTVHVVDLATVLIEELLLFVDM